MRDGQIRDRETAIRSYVVVLKTIAAGHHKLYESRHDCRRSEVQAEIHQYTSRLKEAVNAIRSFYTGGTMPLTSADAFNLSKAFHDLSVSIGEFRFANWDTLSDDNRRTLEDEEWSLLNASSDMVTKAVGLALDESDPTRAEGPGAPPRRPRRP